MENGPFIDDFPSKTSIYNGFSIAMLNNQMVTFQLGHRGTNCSAEVKHVGLLGVRFFPVGSGMVAVYPVVFWKQETHDMQPQNQKLNIWLVVEPTPLKNEFVSWDHEIPNLWKNKCHIPHHQPDICSDFWVSFDLSCFLMVSIFKKSCELLCRDIHGHPVIIILPNTPVSITPHNPHFITNQQGFGI